MRFCRSLLYRKNFRLRKQTKNFWMASTSTNSGGVVYTERVRNKRVIKPLIYGNYAVIFPQKNSKGHTHKWTIFIRPYDRDEDLSIYIRKVQFRLHESYPNNVRIVEKAPFELSETGWGEFDIQIKLYFTDVNEKPVTMFHYLRLHQPLIELKNGQKMVLKELYDEIIFNEPTEPMYRALMKHPSHKKDSRYTGDTFSAQSYGYFRTPKDFEIERQELRNKLEAEHRQIIAEIEDMKRTLKDGCELLERYRKMLNESEEKGGDAVKKEQTEKENS
uniref:YEATS domain-containing protein n=2 Tax=Meloidogyne TaxID=189290 RepID=A0A6V7WBN1_MELEN|nr:unnamed protein product [Meloidogyne enterolobii]